MMTWHSIAYLAYQLVAIGAVIHVVMDNRQPAKTIAWALVIFFLPVVGIVAYIFFGVNTRKERLVSRRSMDQLTRRSMMEFVEQKDLQLPREHTPVIDLFVNENFALPFSGNAVDILTSGYDFFPALLRDIAMARSHIHIDIYIFEDDALGRLVADALIDKARQGVEVRVVFDDVGCWAVGNSFFERMRVEGIEIEPFMPVRFPSFARRANYRNHRKLFVIDGRVGYIGGMNIALRYIKGIDRGKKPSGTDTPSSIWRDTMLRIEGRGVYSLQQAFLVDWYFVDRTLLSDRKYYPTLNIEHSTLNIEHSTLNIEHSTLNIQHSTLNIEHSTLNIEHSEVEKPTQPMFNVQRPMFNVDCLAQTVTSGPTSPFPEIMQGYVRIIMAARKYVYIETPYFLPTLTVLYALKTAAQAGIDVRVLIPLKGDAQFTSWASRSYLREAMTAGVQVSLYTTGFLHSKLMVCDDSIATCGSTNIDFRSFENNFEANIFIYDSTFAQKLKQVYLDDEQHAVLLSSRQHFVSPRFLPRLGESLARLFSPLL